MKHFVANCAPQVNRLADLSHGGCWVTAPTIVFQAIVLFRHAVNEFFYLLGSSEISLAGLNVNRNVSNSNSLLAIFSTSLNITINKYDH